MKIFRPLVVLLAGIALGIFFQRSFPRPSARSSASGPTSVVGSATSVATGKEVKETPTAFVGSVDDLLAKVRRFPNEDDAKVFLQTILEAASPQQLATWAAGLAPLPESRPRVQITLTAVARRWHTA